MSLLGVIVVLVAVGILVLLINTYIPMQENIKRILNIVVIVVLVLWLLSLFGVLSLVDQPIPKVR